MTYGNEWEQRIQVKKMVKIIFKNLKKARKVQEIVFKPQIIIMISKVEKSVNLENLHFWANTFLIKNGS